MDPKTLLTALTTSKKADELLEMFGDLQGVVNNLDACRLTPKQKQRFEAAKIFHKVRDGEPDRIN